MSLPSAKKPSDGCRATRTGRRTLGSGIGRAVSDRAGAAQSRRAASASTGRRTRAAGRRVRAPARDRAGSARRRGGGMIVARTRRPRRRAPARTAARAIAATSAARGQSPPRQLPGRGGSDRGRRPACDPPRRSTRARVATSCGVCQRSSGSFARHCARRGRARAASSATTGGDRRADRDYMIAPISGPGVLPSNALLARRHLVEHAAQREDVRARVGLLPLELLRRHVLKRAEDRPLLRQRPLDLGSASGPHPRARAGPPSAFARARSPGASPPTSSASRWRASGRGGRSPPVRLSSASAISTPILQHLLERQRPLRQPLRERLAFEQLHDQVVDVALAADVEQRADVRVMSREIVFASRSKRGATSRCATRCCGRTLIATSRLEPRVPRAVDLAHPARAERRQDLVGAETGPDGECAQLSPTRWTRSRNRGSDRRGSNMGSTLRPVSQGSCSSMAFSSHAIAWSFSPSPEKTTATMAGGT